MEEVLRLAWLPTGQQVLVYILFFLDCPFLPSFILPAAVLLVFLFFSLSFFFFAHRQNHTIKPKAAAEKVVMAPQLLHALKSLKQERGGGKHCPPSARVPSNN